MKLIKIFVPKSIPCQKTWIPNSTKDIIHFWLSLFQADLVKKRPFLGPSFQHRKFMMRGIFIPKSFFKLNYDFHLWLNFGIYSSFLWMNFLIEEKKLFNLQCWFISSIHASIENPILFKLHDYNEGKWEFSRID